MNKELFIKRYITYEMLHSYPELRDYVKKQIIKSLSDYDIDMSGLKEIKFVEKEERSIWSSNSGARFPWEPTSLRSDKIIAITMEARFE